MLEHSARHDAEGDSVYTICYGRMPPAPNCLDALTHRDVDRLMQRLRDDVKVIREKVRDIPVVQHT